MPWRRLLLHSPWLLALAWWPCTGRYTSLGLDHEPIVQSVRRLDCLRVRSPGDGSVYILWVRERCAASAPAFLGFDWGGTFLQPPPDLQPATGVQQAGFWGLWGNATERAAPAIVVGAECWWVVGMPHGLLVLLFAGIAFLGERRRRRARSHESRLAPPPCAA